MSRGAAAAAGTAAVGAGRSGGFSVRGLASSLDAGLAVFEHEAFFRGYIHELGGEQEHVRCRFAVFDVLSCDNDGKDIGEAGELQGADDNMSEAAGGNRNRAGMADFAGVAGHGLDGVDEVQVVHKELLLVVGDGQGVQLGAVFLV